MSKLRAGLGGEPPPLPSLAWDHCPRRLLREKLHPIPQILREGVSTRRLLREKRQQRQRHPNSTRRRFLRRRKGFPALHPEARADQRENRAGRFGGPTGRRSQPRPPRGTSKPWVRVTPPSPSQDRALKERRSGCERATAAHGSQLFSVLLLIPEPPPCRRARNATARHGFRCQCIGVTHPHSVGTQTPPDSCARY